jgi:ribosomal small subunit protein bTHX
MGKGDIKTRKGKIFNHSYGIKRHRKRKRRNRNIYPKIFELIIIESLNESEKHTGKILFDETIKYKQFQETNLSSSLIIANSKNEFISCLRKIKKRIKKDKLFPLLHIETHGSEKGLHLSNGEILRWEEFFNETREINIDLKNSLMLNLSMCHGISLIAKIDPMKRAPFRAIVSTSSEITWNKLLEGFEIFYSNYFFSFAGADSVNEVNKVLYKDGERFNYLKVEDFFDGFTNINRDPVFTKRLINDFAVKEKATNPRFKDLDFKEVFNYSKGKIISIMEEAKKSRDYFLMKDIK